MYKSRNATSSSARHAPRVTFGSKCRLHRPMHCWSVRPPISRAMSAHLDPCLSCNARNYESTARGQYPDARRRSTSSRATSTPIDDRFHHPTRTRTFPSSSSLHRSRRMFGFTLCLHRCAHCCPVRVPMTRAMSLHRFPCSRCNASKSSSSRVDHGRVSRASSLGIARGKTRGN